MDLDKINEAYYKHLHLLKESDPLGRDPEDIDPNLDDDPDIDPDIDLSDYENDEYNTEDYFPYGDPDGDDEDEDEDEPSMYQEFHGGMDEIQDMMNPGSEYSTPSDLYESYSKKPYNPLYPEREALENVFSDLDRMLDDYMLSDKQKARYEQIKKRLMHISTSFK